MDQYVREKETGPFRFVASSDPETDRFYKHLLREIAERVRREAEGHGFLALVLSGSLALGEGSGYREAGGGVRPGSDIDLYLIVEEGRLGAWGDRTARVRERLLSALGVPGLVVDLGPTSPERIARLEPTLAHCLLVRHGQTLAGDPEVFRRAAPDLPFEAIPPRDGFLLLMNRTVEFLADGCPAPRDEAAERDFWYLVGKTVRDVGTSALVVRGAFAPTAEDRIRAMAVLLAKSGPASPGRGFEEDHRFWWAQKARPDLAAVRSRYGGEGAPDEARRIVREYVEAFWEWEATLVSGACPGSSPLAALRGVDRFPRRVRRWAEHARRGGTAAAARHVRLGLPVTPVVANYAAAYLLLRASGLMGREEPTAREAEDLAEAYRIAPVRGAPERSARRRWIALRGSVCTYWDREVMGGARPPAPWVES